LKNEALRLERTARKVAFGKPKRADIRVAVRDLTLAALRRRVLTLPHVADVATAIRHGIEPENAGVTGNASYARALEGLLAALDVALNALDLAAREYSAVGGRLAPDELAHCLAALEGLPPGGRIAARASDLRKSLRAAVDGETEGGMHVLGLIASGALLGLLESTSRETVDA